MPVNTEAYNQVKNFLAASGSTLVAVSKTKPVSDIRELYQLGQRDFGENYVQELVDKAPELPNDIRWHFIGHLQSNKVKYLAPFIHLVHGVDSFGLLKEINKQAAKNNRVIDVLLQVHIAEEKTKFGMDEQELGQTLQQYLLGGMNYVNIKGLMGMASFSDDQEKVRMEFRKLKQIQQRLLPAFPSLKILSMGMSGDYQLAIEEGSNMVRIGSLLFGARN